MGGLAAAHGPRRAYTNAKNLVHRERIEFGLVVRRGRARAANAEQATLPLGPRPTAQAQADHPVLHSIEVANWTHEPDNIRLVNPPKNKPVPEGNRSDLKSRIRQILRDADGESIPQEELRLQLGVLKESLSRCLKTLMRDGLVSKWKLGGRTFVRATART
jgi:hypothetical protein